MILEHSTISTVRPRIIAHKRFPQKYPDTVNIQNFGAAKFRHFAIFDISAAIYFRRGVPGRGHGIVRQML